METILYSYDIIKHIVLKGMLYSHDWVSAVSSRIAKLYLTRYSNNSTTLVKSLPILHDGVQEIKKYIMQLQHRFIALDVDENHKSNVVHEIKKPTRAIFINVFITIY